MYLIRSIKNFFGYFFRVRGNRIKLPFSIILSSPAYDALGVFNQLAVSDLPAVELLDCHRQH